MTATDTMGKLHRAICIVTHQADSMIANGQEMPGETLKAAEALMREAMAELAED